MLVLQCVASDFHRLLVSRMHGLLSSGVAQPACVERYLLRTYGGQVSRVEVKDS